MNNKRSEYNRIYYEKNRESIIEKHLQYYHENKTRINKDNKIYFQNYYEEQRKNYITSSEQLL